MNKLKKNVRKRSAYKELCDSQFVLPLRIYNSSEQESCDESSDEIKSVNSENEDLKAKLSNARQEIYKLSATVKRQTTTILRLTDKIDKLKKKLLLINVTKDKGNQCNLLKQQTNELLCQLEDLSLEVEDLKKNSENQTDNNNNTGTPQIINFKMKNCRGSPYSAKLRELCYIFRSRNISLEHVSPVIRSVLSMVDFHVENLPSLSTISNFTSELGLVSRIQMEEVLEKTENLTMHRDATTKKGKHYYGVEFSTGEETLTAGIREVSDGKGETYASCTKEILSDISATNSSKILNNVSNFMTDRSSTEQKVNRILSEEIESNSDVNSFKCAVHPLLQFSEVCQKEILSIEKENSEKMDTSVKNDSNTLSLLKCVSKLFYKDGTGDPLLASTYVKKEIRISKIPIMNFRGTRFNTLFYNAAGTFFLKDQILGYLLSSKSSLNFIQNFILQSLQNDVVLAIIRTLGIMCKIVTEPYMKVAESSSLSVICVWRKGLPANCRNSNGYQLCPTPCRHFPLLVRS
ncbi:hypothetical protein FSP39_011838 [Pinctada imbricata]|uniref:Uncharacterized protein n=1 Tax=Pinctada imbricata TaxID=66713 RepID=A0AA88XFE1_PINIB|nr:hypothetical protein FSP39_011838 [Pinctada imbricata]